MMIQASFSYRGGTVTGMRLVEKGRGHCVAAVSYIDAEGNQSVIYLTDGSEETIYIL